MAMKWNYPETSTLQIDNNVDADGYLITDGEVTASSQKTISFKGFKTPDDDEDANAETSTYRAFTTVILGIFGLADGIVLNSGKARADAEIQGEPE